MNLLDDETVNGHTKNGNIFNLKENNNKLKIIS